MGFGIIFAGLLLPAAAQVQQLTIADAVNAGIYRDSLSANAGSLQGTLFVAPGKGIGAGGGTRFRCAAPPGDGQFTIPSWLLLPSNCATVSFNGSGVELAARGENRGQTDLSTTRIRILLIASSQLGTNSSAEAGPPAWALFPATSAIVPTLANLCVFAKRPHECRRGRKECPRHIGLSTLSRFSPRAAGTGVVLKYQ